MHACVTESEENEDCCDEPLSGKGATVPAKPNTTAKTASKATATKYLPLALKESSLQPLLVTLVNKCFVEVNSIRKLT